MLFCLFILTFMPSKSFAQGEAAEEGDHDGVDHVVLGLGAGVAAPPAVAPGLDSPVEELPAELALLGHALDALAAVGALLGALGDPVRVPPRSSTGGGSGATGGIHVRSDPPCSGLLDG